MSDKPPCKYGATCYQKNPSHLKAYFHPKTKEDKEDKKKTKVKKTKPVLKEKPEDTKNEETEEEEKKEEEDDESIVTDVSAGEKQVCRFGKYCYRTSQEHRQQFGHPTVSVISLVQ